MKTTILVLPVLLSVLAVAAPARADDDPASASFSTTSPPSAPANADETTDTRASRSKNILLGAKVGGIAPFGGLNPNVVGGLEAGYVLPFAHRMFGLVLDVSYSAPKKEGTEANDPRVDGGTYSWHLTEQILTFMPHVMFRYEGIKAVTLFAGIGPRIYLLQSTVKGAVGGVDIPETTEKSTKVGVGVPLGLELPAGPGALFGNLLFEYGGLDHLATGDSNTGALSLVVGYRLYL